MYQDLNIKTETLNLLGDKIGKILEDRGVDEDFLNKSLVV